ncbi:bifunctional diaminohydroxyphosphoribosylaminopyrimidine deaminase/5-amino-6-(5-phosphoribosylamino)uracil reductase RibD [Peredibacter sp. HCB2-198]|uniref:bifunctional diaminohydroxyphosphoribosylaminopyrimidine deaminase/5-amino-6-(5-phosphoribosylamino)uracil reductase RibD n=1 Tax=Peredibacter sp. HCB2-198 TaxID=3383025 RepID=UPI0038B4CE8F
MTNEELIQETFELAKEGKGHTWPNPMVGAVLVKDGKIIARGFHHKAGQDHAEIDAIKNATESVEGATLYVNLEPCCHTNKSTPPCAQRLIQEKIKKVVISNLDPNPNVNGKGVELLKQNGIEVEHGILAKEGEALNEVFFTSQKLQRPFIHLKMASSLDGKTALSTGESQWITGPLARERVHLLRSQHQAVIVGAETVRKDNPKLNVRLEDYHGEQPYRIVFTQSGKLPKDALLFTDELKHKTLIYTFSPLSFAFPKEQVVQITSLEEAMKDLYHRKLMNLLMEGGATLASNFIIENLIDRITVFLNPSLIGSGTSLLGDLGLSNLEGRPRLKNIETNLIGEDIFISGRLT